MIECKYSLIRYIPDSTKNEPINLGLVMHSHQSHFFAFEWDLRRVATKITRPDRESLHHYEEELLAIEDQHREWEEATFQTIPVNDPNFLERVSDFVGNRIVFDAPRGCLSEDPDTTFEHLFDQFVSAGVRGQHRMTKRTLIRNVKNVFVQRDVGAFLKLRPIVRARHKEYTLPLGIRHSVRTFVDALNLSPKLDASYRAMVTTAGLWDDAREMPANRDAQLCVLVNYPPHIRIPEGEALMRDHEISVVHAPAAVLNRIHVNQVREWN